MKGHTKGSLQLLGVIVVAGFIVLGGFTYGNNHGWFGQPQAGQAGTTYNIISGGEATGAATGTGAAVTGSTVIVPIGSLNANVMDCYAGSYVTTGTDLYVYSSSVNPSSPTANTIDSFTPGTASANTRTNTNTNYKVLFTDATGTANYYDRSYYGLDASGNPVAGKILAQPSLTGATSTNVLDFTGSNPDTSNCVVYNATLPDIVNEATDANFGPISGGSADCANTTYGAGSTPSACAFIGPQGADVVNGDTMSYNKTIGAGTAYIKLTLGASGGNQAAKDEVVCFADSDGDMNKTEFTSIAVERISGTSYTFEDETGATVGSEWVNYWANDKCLKILAPTTTPSWLVGGSASGEYKITFTVQEGNWLNGAEFTISVNDLGVKGSTLTEFGKDLRNGAGAAKTTITINAAA